MRIQVLCTADLRFHAKAVLLTSVNAASPSRFSQWALKQLPYTVTASFRILTGFSFAHPTGCNLIAITFVHIRFYLVTYFLPQNHKIVKIAVGRFRVFSLYLSVIFSILILIFMHIFHDFIWFMFFIYSIMISYNSIEISCYIKSSPSPPSLWQQKRADHIIYWSTPAPGIWLHRFRWQMHGKENVSHRCSLR